MINYVKGVFAQSWTFNFNLLALILIACIVIPTIISYIMYGLGICISKQTGRAFGSYSQMVFGSVGNVLHEIENVVIAKIGGHDITRIRFRSFRNFHKFHLVSSVDHNWVAHNFYESLFDFFLGTLPFYITSLILWCVQYLLGGGRFHVTEKVGRHPSLSNNALVYFGKSFGESLASSFSTANILTGFLFLIIVVAIASTAYTLSTNEIIRLPHGLIPLVLILLVVWFVIAFTKQSVLGAKYIWWFIGFSGFLLAHVFVYLVIILAITTFFALLNKYVYGGYKND